MTSSQEEGGAILSSERYFNIFTASSKRATAYRACIIAPAQLLRRRLKSSTAAKHDVRVPEQRDAYADAAQALIRAPTMRHVATFCRPRKHVCFQSRNAERVSW